MQYAWELFVTYAIGPVFMAALLHPVETCLALFALSGLVIYVEA